MRINTHGQYTTPTCPKCAYKISEIFSRVFEFALAELMRREYFHFYSIMQQTNPVLFWNDVSPLTFFFFKFSLFCLGLKPLE